MYLIQLIPYCGQGVTAGVFDPINSNADLAVFDIRLDQRFVSPSRGFVADFQHHTRAPDEAIVNLLVHADNEAGDDAGG